MAETLHRALLLKLKYPQDNVPGEIISRNLVGRIEHAHARIGMISIPPIGSWQGSELSGQNRE